MVIYFFCPYLIIDDFGPIKVRVPINLYNQPTGGTIKISNVRTNAKLSTKFETVKSFRPDRLPKYTLCCR